VSAVTNTLHVGIVGAGAWAAAAHVPGFMACDDVRIAAICDTEPARAAALARSIDGAAAYTSIAEMLAGARLDIVSIVTPTDTHAMAVTAAFAAGAHVLCEKPLGRTLAEARAMAALAAQTSLHTRMGFTMRFAPAIRRVRELITDGLIGTPYHVQMFLQNGQFISPDKPLHWKMTRLHAGAGAVVEYGVHGLDILRWLLGPVSRVCATGRTFIPERAVPGSDARAAVDVEDSCGWLMEFANGAAGVCHAGWTTVGRAPGLEIRIFGAKAAIQVVLSDDQPGSERLSVAMADEGRFEPTEIPSRLATKLPVTETWRHRFQHDLIAGFVGDIRDGVRSGPDFADGVRAQEVLDAVVTSMAEDRWVRVDSQA
jgi:predicted dehydrogenase